MASTRYYIDIEHAGLGKFQRVQGTDRYVVQQKAAAKRHEWEQQWQRRCLAAEERAERQRSREQHAQDKEAKRAYVESRKLEADDATLAAERAVAEIDHILAHTLKIDDRVDFDALKERTTFSERPPAPPRQLSLPPEPEPGVPDYRAPKPSFWTKLWEMLIPSAKQRRLQRHAEEEQSFRQRVNEANSSRAQEWRAQCADAHRQHTEAQNEYKRRREDWTKRKHAFEARQETTNTHIDLLAQRYHAHDADAVEHYCDLVLSVSSYPENFPQTFSIQYRPESKLLLLEYVLPLPAHMPRLKSVRYVQSRDELIESELPVGAQKKLYDSAIYQIAIRSLHEIFEADVANAVQSVAFNGVVETVDEGTGQPIRPCIISVQASKADFEQFNLAAVDPKACFRKLKGIGSAQLHALAPVPPIIRFNKDDVRFVDGREVLGDVAEGQNIACLPWEDFEHLIRDLFEREFSGEGTDVRITRASRDGGIDAVVFDPDPIRGGKLVIQAKRYTSTVGVAAVRDLYGAMTAERAAKGILVTTAAFGHDSYEFAKDKPITLLDGGALLYLLQKHGVPATIDLQQAKRIMCN